MSAYASPFAARAPQVAQPAQQPEAVVQYMPEIGAATVTAFGASSGPTQVVASHAFGQGLLKTLVDAELLAARHGLVPLEHDASGAAGIRVSHVGAAFKNLNRAPARVRTLYRAAHRAAWEASQAARPPTSNQPPLNVAPAVEGEIGWIPQALIAVGAVAMAVAGFLTAREALRFLEVRTEHARQVALADRALDLEQRGVPHDAPSWRVLETLASKSLPTDQGVFGDVGSGWPILIALVAGGGLVLYLTTQNQGRRR